MSHQPEDNQILQVLYEVLFPDSLSLMMMMMMMMMMMLLMKMKMKTESRPLGRQNSMDVGHLVVVAITANQIVVCYL